ncbi:MAG: pentapeptide repeat-containing protein [Paraburkholderia fungorum]
MRQANLRQANLRQANLRQATRDTGAPRDISARRASHSQTYRSIHHEDQSSNRMESRRPVDDRGSGSGRPARR